MSEALLEWRSYRYFPYERDFARLEVENLFRSKPRGDELGLRVPSASFREDRADRLTYFAKAVHPGGRVTVPLQARLEASAHEEERERQATRYSAHGLHEYKGKFNPQVVRAIGNILGLEKGAFVLDPFCGSGTTLLEGAHIGWSVTGIDRNPLAVRIANAKVHALRRARGTLEFTAAKLVGCLHGSADILSGLEPLPPNSIDDVLGTAWSQELSFFDYLSSWFPLPVLAQIVVIRRSIRFQARSLADRDIFEIILSDLLREASFQEPADLRIRRRKDPHLNYPLVEMFIDAVQERIPRIARARKTLGEIEGSQKAILGDICAIDLEACRALPKGGFDAVITSPPYETALPYIDTQRLSLVVLGDIEASEILNTEKSLIGAREIGTREKKEIENSIRRGGKTNGLPLCVLELCRELLDAAYEPGNGFRRQNRPALTYRYFKRMSEFFVAIKPSLKPGARLALVVGRNRTVLGGREYEIDTPRLLASIAEHCGYSRVEERPMDTYPRYQIHRRNSIDAETLVIVSAP